MTVNIQARTNTWIVSSDGDFETISDAKWKELEKWLPLKRGGRGRPITIDMREAVNAMFYIVKTGCQWKNLPKEFPNYHSVFYHYRKWCRDGTWELMNCILRYQLQQRVGRFAHPHAAIVDSQSVKTTEVGGICGYDAGKKVNGRKRYILVCILLIFKIERVRVYYLTSY